MYDQNTLKLLWTNYTPGYEGTEAEIEHPRDVKIDHATGKAYVTGRYYISSIDLKTHEVKKLRIAASRPVDSRVGRGFRGDVR